jgi:hypothetical protein
VGCGFYGVHFPNPRIGYAVASSSEAPAVYVAKTEDGGNTWRLWATPPEASPEKVVFLDANTGFMKAYTGTLYSTTDGGQTWSQATAAYAARDIKFADPEVGWTIGGSYGNQLSYTTDRGRRWTSRTISFPAAPNAFSLPRRDRAYAVGPHGMVYRYRVVPVSYQAAAHSLDAPIMPGFDSPVFAQVATLTDVVAKLRAKLSTTAAGQLSTQTLAPSTVANAAEASTQTSTPPSVQTGSFTQSAEAPASGTAAASQSQAPSTGGSATGTFQQSTDAFVAPVPPNSAPPSAGFQQDIGTGPVPGGYLDICCAPLIQQLETTANTFATTVPSFSTRFRNLNLILEGFNFLNTVVNQANTLRQSIRALRQAKNAQAAAIALNTVQTQVNGISSSGGFVQDTTLPPQP